MTFQPLRPLDPAHLDAAGWGWLYREAGPAYVAPEALVVPEADVVALEAAANELYERSVEAAGALIEAGRLDALGLPESLHRLVQATWEDERHWHVLGRFDLAGGLDGTPPRLLEFNADTPTLIPETALVQWAMLRANGLDEAAQFNALFERLAENLGRWRGKWPDLEAHLAVAYAPGAIEDRINAEVVAEAARTAGFTVADVLPFDTLAFAPDEGVFHEGEGGWTRYDFVYKFIPWEWIAWDEPALVDMLEGLILKGLTAVANPPYALALQSKALLAALWEQFPGHPHLLETCRAPWPSPTGLAEKVLFGREGANVRLLAPSGSLVAARDGDYGLQPRIYQALAPLPQHGGHHYQAGVFYAHEACALGVRRQPHAILDDRAEFVPHVIA
ncbi:MAG TPA: glutathionylspermidine synthase family protein [Rhodothermales bacterium]|nr:glutathionylspermidine synthase family protein [Rhodothermales bacterium]